MTTRLARSEEAQTLARRGPTCTVRDVLEPYRGARIVYPPHVDGQGRYVGNNGDLLIMAGVYRLIADLELEVAASEEDADLVLMCGGGGLMERSRWVRGILRDCSQRLGHLPMVVLPSSFDFPTRPLAAEIGQRSAPLTLFCREAYSFLQLTEDHDLPDGCHVEMDHDMAFELEDSPLLRRLRQVGGERILVVERTDLEHPATAFQKKSSALRPLKRVLPPWLKSALWKARASYRSRTETPMMARCEAMVREDFTSLSHLPRRVLDVSNPSAGDFDFFLDEVAHATLTFSTRLHVAILAAMLHRPAVVFEGPYHKIRGVFEFSLAERDTARLARL